MDSSLSSVVLLVVLGECPHIHLNCVEVEIVADSVESKVSCMGARSSLKITVVSKNLVVSTVASSMSCGIAAFLK